MSAVRIELPPYDFVSIGVGTQCETLKCRSAEINKWFASKAWKQHSQGAVRVVCAVERGKPDRPLGFYAVATVAEEVTNLPGRYHPFGRGQHFSALQLVWLATSEPFEGQGLGSVMVGEVIRLFARVGPQIGLPHLIVVPDPENHGALSEFYGKRDFTPYKDGEAMYLDLPFAVDAVQKVEAKMAEWRAELARRASGPAG